MDDKQLKRLWDAIKLTDKLFKERTHAGDWCRNLEEGSRGLDSKLEYANYIMWLSNPHNFEVSHNVEFSDIDEDNKYINQFTLPDNFTEKRYNNGTEQFVHIRNENFYQKPEVEDEKEDFELVNV